ncbi:MAG: leukotoxin LktA family filamentous adhesin, partial [Candidatus Muiribacteriaceae bacterium]
MLRRRDIRRLKKLLVWIILFFFIGTDIMAAGAMIIPDGSTDTSLIRTGNVTDIHTGTKKDNNAFNSFSVFDIHSGQTVNLYLPDNTDNLLNMVYDRKSLLDGIMNSYKDGSVGGNVFFMNPNGIIVGNGARINTGSMFFATPERDFMRTIIDEYGNISDMATQAVLEGDIPLDDTGVISIDGEV